MLVHPGYEDFEHAGIVGRKIEFSGWTDAYKRVEKEVRDTTDSLAWTVNIFRSGPTIMLTKVFPRLLRTN